LTATDLLRDAHREIEAALDNGGDALGLLLRHYEVEAIFFDAIRGDFPAMVRKMEDQHEEARELGRHFDDPLLRRRFLAIAQHNIIEEERDLFPLADRWLAAEDQQRLAARMS
jgi:hypothetical protein